MTDDRMDGRRKPGFKGTPNTDTSAATAAAAAARKATRLEKMVAELRAEGYHVIRPEPMKVL